MNVVLSIITINLNDSKGLEKTILSVVSQSSSQFEYIIIDGGSIDGSVEIIRKYENRITFWTSEKDAGIYNGMNRGLSKAKGKFCMFLNSGDFLQSGNIIRNAEYLFLDSNDIIYGDLMLDYGNKQLRKKYPFPFTLYNFAYTTIPHPASFIRTSLLRELGGYDEEFTIVSDWIFFIRAYIENRAIMKRIDEVISVHNMFGISSRPNEFGREPEDAILKYYPFLKADFEHFKQLQYFQLSRPHQYLEKFILIAKRVISILNRSRIKEIAGTKKIQ